METKLKKNGVLSTLAIVLLVLSSAPAESQQVSSGFIYNLSTFTGPILLNWSRVMADKKRNEIYAVYQNRVSVFNESGMEIYHFGDDFDLGQIVDVAVDEEGDILLLAYKESRGEIIRCNYRGEPKSTIELRNIPNDLNPLFSNFSPNRIVYQGGNIYLASLSGLKVLVTDREGNFSRAYDIFPLLDLQDMERGNLEIVGFSVDGDGNILMTIPVLFSAYILSPEGQINPFGKPGSAPGKFNIVAGIARDNMGNYLVVDRLKAAVMVFDKSFNFVTQFGTRGYKPGNLIFPEDIALDDGQRVYVTQMGKRGVSVFKLTYN
jgi:6-bladed beta-propeller protein